MASDWDLGSPEEGGHAQMESMTPSTPSGQDRRVSLDPLSLHIYKRNTPTVGCGLPRCLQRHQHVGSGASGAAAATAAAGTVAAVSYIYIYIYIYIN